MSLIEICSINPCLNVLFISNDCAKFVAAAVFSKMKPLYSIYLTNLS